MNLFVLIGEQVQYILSCLLVYYVEMQVCRTTPQCIAVVEESLQFFYQFGLFDFLDFVDSDL